MLHIEPDRFKSKVFLSLTFIKQIGMKEAPINISHMNLQPNFTTDKIYCIHMFAQTCYFSKPWCWIGTSPLQNERLK